jgi:hypothetical protein
MRNSANTRRSTRAHTAAAAIPQQATLDPVSNQQQHEQGSQWTAVAVGRSPESLASHCQQEQEIHCQRSLEVSGPGSSQPQNAQDDCAQCGPERNAVKQVRERLEGRGEVSVPAADRAHASRMPRCGFGTAHTGKMVRPHSAEAVQHSSGSRTSTTPGPRRSPDNAALRKLR